MPILHRVHQTYDHRLREAIAITGNRNLFPEVRIPRSTRSTWACCEAQPVVTSSDVEVESYELLDRLAKQEIRLNKQATIIGLLVRMLKVRGGKLELQRCPNGASKSTLLRGIASASRTLALSTVLSIVGISRSRYRAWERREKECGLDDQSSCPKSFPTQLTREELSSMKDMVTSDDYRHFSVVSLALHAQRIGAVFVSVNTWYKQIRRWQWLRPRKRVHPPKPKVGLRAKSPNEICHLDTTVIRLLGGGRIYLQAVIDNFSRRILAWRLNEALSAATTREILLEAATRAETEEVSPDVPKPSVVVDAGCENFGEADALFSEDGRLKRVIAQADVVESNSMIESWWLQLKYWWLFLHKLDTIEGVRRLVEFYVREHNMVIPRAVLRGRTPDEVYSGQAEDLPDKLVSLRQQARVARVTDNRAKACGLCQATRPNPVQLNGVRTFDRNAA